MDLTDTSGGIICLFDELHKEAQSRLRARGTRGKVLSLTTIAKQTHLDYKAFFPMQNKTLKQYDAEVVKRLCLFFGIDIKQLFYWAVPNAPRPSIGDLAIVQEPLPTDTGTIESLLQVRINEWQEKTEQSQPLSYKQLGDLVGLHPQTVSAWVNNTISIYSLVVLEKWCVFFDAGIEGFLRYIPPEGASLSRIPLPARAKPQAPPHL